MIEVFEGVLQESKRLASIALDKLRDADDIVY